MYIPILTYHRLLNETPTVALDPARIAVSVDQFRSHLAWLSRWGYQSVSLADYVRELRSATSPPIQSDHPHPSLPPRGGGCRVRGRFFAITFDDGYEEVLTLALPILQEFHCRATVFAVTGHLGGTNAWDDGQWRLLDADQLRALQHAGITIGAHTCHHVHLTKVDVETARHEIVNSRHRLEEILQRPVTLFAYPYGESTPGIEAQVELAGFGAAFATDRAPRDHVENYYRLRRVVVFPRTNNWELAWKVQGWYPRYQDWKRSKSEMLESKVSA